MAERSVRPNYKLMSRISWGAILAGAFVAFVLMVVLNSFGMAVGLSDGDGLGTGTVIWAGIVGLVSLFAGGWVMARMVSYETREEAMIQGVVLWGIVVFAMLYLAMSGIQMGLSSIVGAANALNVQIPGADLNNIAGELGLSAQQMEAIQQRLGQGMERAAVNAWWSFAGIVLSLVSACVGAIAGRRVEVETVIRRDRPVIASRQQIAGV